MDYIFFIYSLVEGHLGCFQVLVIRNNTVLNIVDQCHCYMIEHLLNTRPRVLSLGLKVD